MTNTAALLNMYREKGVISALNQHGAVIFYGLGRINKSQRDVLLAIPQDEVKAAMKWQVR